MDNAELSTNHYPLMKDSGVEWLGRIPAGWKIKKLKYLVNINEEVLPETTTKSFPIKYVDISNVKAGVGILSMEELSFSSAPSRARRIVRDGDVIVSTVRTYLRSITKISNPPDNLIVSTGFAVIRPRRLNSDYTGYMFYSENLIGEIVSRSTGVSYPAINASEIGNIPVPIPSIKEQTAIASFLDRKAAEIDALIAQKERLLELYEEEKTAIINHAVTKGLDPNAELKDSGVEWLGKIPVGWEVKSFRYNASNFSNGTAAVQREFDTNYPVSRIETISTGKIDFNKTGFLNEEDALEKFKLDQGDILLSHINSLEYVGNCAIYNGSRLFYHGMNLLRIVPNQLPSWLFWYLKSYVFRSSIKAVCKHAINQVSVPANELKSLPIPTPPKPEQANIANFLDLKTKEIDSKIKKTQRIIELQKEYRTALISEAVTGKIKVPELPTQEASA